MSTRTDHLRMFNWTPNRTGERGLSTRTEESTENLQLVPTTNFVDETETMQEIPRIGETFAQNRYRLDRILDRGGMGVVALATHMQLQQRVAVKFLRNPHSTVAVARFMREAQAASRLRGVHVVRVTDFGQLESGAPYMVMELLEGQSLAAHLRKNGSLDVADTIEYVLQVCEAMAEAHGEGIIHRDLKPSNLFLTTTPTGKPCVKVLDFGISKVISSPDTKVPDVPLTKSNTRLGTKWYMSPEQFRSGSDVDERSDVWSLGIILYELLTGRRPWDSDNDDALVVKIVMDPPPPIVDFRPDIPADLEAVIRRCLQRYRTSRFANVAELASALVTFGPAHAAPHATRAAQLLEAKGFSVSVSGASICTASPPVVTDVRKREPDKRRITVAGLVTSVVGAIGIAAFLTGGTARNVEANGSDGMLQESGGTAELHSANSEFVPLKKVVANDVGLPLRLADAPKGNREEMLKRSKNMKSPPSSTNPPPSQKPDEPNPSLPDASNPSDAAADPIEINVALENLRKQIQ